MVVSRAPVCCSRVCARKDEKKVIGVIAMVNDSYLMGYSVNERKTKTLLQSVVKVPPHSGW